MSDMTEPAKAFEEFWSKMTDDQNKSRTELLQPRDVAALAFHSGVVWAASNALGKMRQDWQSAENLAYAARGRRGEA